MAAKPIEVLQLSDIHLMGPTRGSVAPMFERDADETLDAVLADVRRRGRRPDVVVATGDLVHDGAAGAYERLAAALITLDAPAYCLAGNHDQAASFDANLSRPGVHVGRLANVGPWAFAFVDSNRAGRLANDAGALVDRPDRYVSALHGRVDGAELDWLADVLAASPAEHVFLWMHHPPVIHPRYQGDKVTELYKSLFPRFGSTARVRGVGAGHLHCGFESTHDGVTTYCCPSSWLMMDFDTMTFGPPAYRWYTMHDDGRIDSEVHVVDAERYASRAPLSEWLVQLMTGETSITSLLDRPEHEILASLRND